jgi:hypothetical protein
MFPYRCQVRIVRKGAYHCTEIDESEVTGHGTVLILFWVKGNTWPTDDFKAETSGAVERIVSEALDALVQKLRFSCQIQRG